MDAVFRYRLRFAKKGAARFLSHRDLMRLFERAGRRAGLPMAMTGGFNPHPRISLAPALKLGFEGWDEALEIDLSEQADPSAVALALNRTMPAGIAFGSAENLPAGRRSRVAACAYRVFLPAGMQGRPGEPPKGATLSFDGAGAWADVAVDHLAGLPPRIEEVIGAVFGPEAVGRLEVARTRVEFEHGPRGPEPDRQAHASA